MSWKFFHLRTRSVIGCSEHGPFGRDLVETCESCRLLMFARTQYSTQPIRTGTREQLAAFLRASS